MPDLPDMSKTSLPELMQDLHVTELETTPVWHGSDQGDIEAAIVEFKARLPGWWYSMGECDVTCHASCAPTAESPHINLIQTDGSGKVLRRDDPFDSGFHADLPQPSSLATALRDVMDQALAEIERRRNTKIHE